MCVGKGSSAACRCAHFHLKASRTSTKLPCGPGTWPLTYSRLRSGSTCSILTSEGTAGLVCVARTSHMMRQSHSCWVVRALGWCGGSERGVHHDCTMAPTLNSQMFLKICCSPPRRPGIFFPFNTRPRSVLPAMVPSALWCLVSKTIPSSLHSWVNKPLPTCRGWMMDGDAIMLWYLPCTARCS